MSTRPVSVVIDSQDPAALAGFWAAALDWPVTYSDPGEVVVEVADDAGHWGDTGAVPLVFVAVPEPKTGKNRVHLDLASASVEEQTATVERLLGLGASHVDLGQGEVPWVVLADPEGNEFCVLEPRETYAGVERIAAVVLDCADPVALASFWQAATGWRVADFGAGFASLRHPERAATALELVAVPEPKTTKDRLHIDVAPYPDGATEVEAARLTAQGASPVDVGQRDVTWHVLADPEGHEFCVLSAR